MITTDSKNLRNALAVLDQVADGKAPMPILGNVHLEAARSALILRATDLETEVRLTLDADGGSFETTVPCAALKRALGKARGPVTLGLAGGYLHVTRDGGDFKLATTAAEEFPAPLHSVGEPPEWIAEAVAEAQAFERVSYAASTDSTRWNMTGVLAEIGSGLTARLVATDGHRLALAGDFDMKAQAVALLPVAMADAIERLGGAGTLRLGGEQSRGAVGAVGGNRGPAAEWRRDGVRVAAYCPQCEPFRYRQIVPTYNCRSVVIDSKSTLEALASLPREARYAELRIRPDGLDVVSNLPDLGETCVTVPCTLEGEPLTLRVSTAYLRDELRHAANETRAVSIRFAKDDAAKSPMRFGGSGSFSLLMPVR